MLSSLSSLEDMSAHDYLVKCTEPLASPDSLREAIFWSLVSPMLKVALPRDLDASFSPSGCLTPGVPTPLDSAKLKGID